MAGDDESAPWGLLGGRMWEGAGKEAGRKLEKDPDNSVECRRFRIRAG